MYRTQFWSSYVYIWYTMSIFMVYGWFKCIRIFFHLKPFHNSICMFFARYPEEPLTISINPVTKHHTSNYWIYVVSDILCIISGILLFSVEKYFWRGAYYSYCFLTIFLIRFLNLLSEWVVSILVTNQWHILYLILIS